MYKLLVLACIALMQLVLAAASGSGCGGLDAVCCANHVCNADRTLCRDGTCKPCGKDGTPQCDKGPKCDADTLKKDGWCVHNPHVTKPVDPVEVPVEGDCGKLTEQCCASQVCTDDRSACWEGICMTCGQDGKPVCPTGDKCDPGNVPKDNFCVHDHTVTKGPDPVEVRPNKPCGRLNKQCCADQKCNGRRAVCWEGKCKRCGQDGTPKCPTGRPCKRGLKAKDGWCVKDNGK